MQLRAQRGSAAPSTNAHPNPDPARSKQQPPFAPLTRPTHDAVNTTRLTHRNRNCDNTAQATQASHAIPDFSERFTFALAATAADQSGSALDCLSRRIHGCFLRSNSAVARSFASFRRGTADPIMVSRNLHSLKSASKSLSHCCFRSALAREYGATAAKKAFRNAENGSHEQSVSAQQSSG